MIPCYLLLLLPLGGEDLVFAGGSGPTPGTGEYLERFDVFGGPTLRMDVYGAKLPRIDGYGDEAQGCC